MSLAQQADNMVISDISFHSRPSCPGCELAQKPRQISLGFEVPIYLHKNNQEAFWFRALVL